MITNYSSCYYFFSLKWGQVFAWGSNSHGQLGLNIPDQISHSPKMIKSLATKQVIQIACGQNHSMALTNGIIH